MPKLKIFVACPYRLFPLDDYKKVFSEIGNSYDVTFEFADKKITNAQILRKIETYIRECEISLFDISGWNANVALELGIAIGLRSRYFILWNPTWDKNNEVPSDIRGLDRIQYVSNSELETKLILLLKQELKTDVVESESAFSVLTSKIRKKVEDKPGLGLVEISDEISEDKNLVRAALAAMVNKKELKTRGKTKGTKYFSKSMDLRKVPG